jgi:hypothetical protein
MKMRAPIRARSPRPAPAAMPSTFEVPSKRILAPEQLAAFQASETYAELLAYIAALNDAVVGATLSAPCPASPVGVFVYAWRGDALIGT